MPVKAGELFCRAHTSSPAFSFFIFWHLSSAKDRRKEERRHGSFRSRGLGPPIYPGRLGYNRRQGHLLPVLVQRLPIHTTSHPRTSTTHRNVGTRLATTPRGRQSARTRPRRSRRPRLLVRADARYHAGPRHERVSRDVRRVRRWDDGGCSRYIERQARQEQRRGRAGRNASPRGMQTHSAASTSQKWALLVRSFHRLGPLWCA